MSPSTRPHNGLARALDEATSDTPLDEIVANRDQYECPNCGWTAQTRRRSCFVCPYDRPLEDVRDETSAVEREGER